MSHSEGKEFIGGPGESTDTIHISSPEKALRIIQEDVLPFFQTESGDLRYNEVRASLQDVANFLEGLRQDGLLGRLRIGAKKSNY